MVLLVLDASTLDAAMLGSATLHEEDARTLASLQDRPHLIVLNKIDLVEASLATSRAASAATFEAVSTSALSGTGIELLKQRIVAGLTHAQPGTEPALVTNLRQHTALAESEAALARAHTAAEQDLPHELVLLDLYAALEALDSLTGATTSEDILHRIFSTFCIGK